MSFSRWTRTLAAAALCALAWSALSQPALCRRALGAVDIQVANNAQVQSQLVNPDGVQRYRVFLPEGAKFTAAVKGKKDKQAGTSAPPMRMRVLDDFEDDIIEDGFLDKAKLKSKGSGAKAKIVVEDSGEYIVEVFSEDGSLGAFSLTVKWVNPKAAKIKGEELFFDGDETGVDISVDDDTLLTMSVKKTGRSTAQPFFDRIEGDELDQELDNQPKQKKIRVLEGGDLYVVIGNTTGDGTIGGSVKMKQPKTKKVTIPITPVRGSEKKITGKVASPSKDVFIEADDEDIVGEAILGASVLVPAGALTQPTSIQIGTSEPMLPPTPAAGQGAGPTVFFGPPGTQFQTPVTVSIPFNSELLDNGDTSDLSVFTSDEDGNVEEIDNFVVDVDDESVSFQVSHFSSFRVFISGLPQANIDLDADGGEDVILPAPQADDGAGRVYVLLSSQPAEGDFTTDTSAVSVAIAGGAGQNFGTAYAVGDVTGDGTDDLLVLGDGVQDGTCFVFAGGPTFNPTSSATASFRFDGAVGFGGMNTVATGDVNDDGVADIVVGSEDGPDGRGAVVVWFGGTGLMSETTTGADLTFTGEQVGDLFGASVTVGDVTNDGRGDVIVGADMIDNPGRAGAVYVQLGGTGIQGAAAVNMDVVIAGSGADAGFGLQTAVADVTGDGVADLVASEFDDDLGGPGAVYVFQGSTSFGPTSTADADGVYRGQDDEVIGSALLLVDLTRDGVAEIVIGARGAVGGDGGIFIVDGGTSVVGADVSLSVPDIAGPGFFEGFPIFGPPIGGALVGIVAFAPGNEDGDIGSGAAYFFGGDPRARQVTSTDDADGVIYGQADESLGGDIF